MAVQSFRYPYRIADLAQQLWQEILAAADAEHQAAVSMLSDGQVPLDENFDSPAADLERLVGPRLDQVVALLEDRDRAVEDDMHPVPAGGTAGQALEKATGQDYDLIWATPASATHSIPAGGTTGQALEKVSNADYDVAWETVAASVPPLVVIQEIDTTSAAVASIDFASIPATVGGQPYRTLILDCSLRSVSGAGAPDTCRLTFNGDTSLAYMWMLLRGLPTGPVVDNGFDTAITCGYVPTVSSTSKTNVAYKRIIVPQYRNSHFVRSVQVEGGAINTAGTVWSTESVHGMWDPVSDGRSPVVTRLTLTLSSGSNFSGGGGAIPCIATLYGQI